MTQLQSQLKFSILHSLIFYYKTKQSILLDSNDKLEYCIKEEKLNCA